MPDPEPTPPKPDGGDKTFTQAELDRIVADRLNREKGKYADYEDVKAKASKLDELEAANKSEAEKANARAEAAERKAAQAESEALRLTVAAEKGVKARWLTGSTREELEKAAEEYLADHPQPAGGGGGGGTPAPGKPKEDLRGGGDPTGNEPVELDPRKLAEGVPRGF